MKVMQHIGTAALAGVLVLVWTLPLLWLISTAFKSRLDITSMPPRIFPTPTIDNFKADYFGMDTAQLLRNSIVIAGLATVFTLAFALPAAYGIAKSRQSVRTNLLVFLLSTRFAPPIALSVPYFFIVSVIGLRGSFLAISVIHFVAGVSVATWILVQQIDRLPRGLGISACIDGHTRAGAIWFVILPNVLPGIALAAALSFLLSWNEYLFASLLSSSATRPITPALPSFLTQGATRWGEFAAVAVIAAVPTLLLAFYVGRALAAGSSTAARQRSNT